MPPPISHCVSGRLSRDPLSVPCGRRSRQNATQSSSAPSTGRTRAGVAFPAPPIEAAIGIIFMVSDAIANAQGRKRPISYTRTCEILVSHGNSQRPERRECRKDLFVERRPGGVNRIYPSLFRRRLTYFQKWCCERGLNSRPHPYQGCALPLSYRSIPAWRSGGRPCRRSGLAIAIAFRRVQAHSACRGKVFRRRLSKHGLLPYLAVMAMETEKSGDDAGGARGDAEAQKRAAWDSTLRRYIPLKRARGVGGVRSGETFGTPRIIRHKPGR